MRVTYYGHACIAVEVQGRTLLFDPYFGPNAIAAGIDPGTITADYILITHGHEDHVGEAASIAKRTGATVISNFEITQWLSARGAKKTLPMNIGGTARLDCGIVKFVNAVHSSSLPDGSYGGCPGGFVVSSPEGSFYFSGDTALCYDMKLIGESTQLTFAALCLGDTFTMGVDDAVKAAEFLQCNQILGMHYDTVPMLRIDRHAAQAKFSVAGKKLILLDIGQTHTF
ncbi:MAG: metal-dependent hydrolase [Verrucomicrobiae bacterium]|nr:metal-dependent hydrolase [Verrucomicrobiae bacterium]